MTTYKERYLTVKLNLKKLMNILFNGESVMMSELWLNISD